MLLLPNSCFLHVPKTGGSWAKLAIVKAGIPAMDISTPAKPHPGLAECPRPDLFKFAFVRHPLSLYRSYWQYKMTYGWDPNNAMDMICRNENFVSFVEAVLENFPGVYASSLELFMGPQGHEIDFIGRYENLVEDLVTALQRAGETFDADAIRSLPPHNVSDKQGSPAQFTPTLEAAVRKAEAGVFSRFHYD